jgi:hypothetical protein
MLEYIESRTLSLCNNIKTFELSTLYIAIPHSNLKDRIKELVQLCFLTQNVQRRYKYLVSGRDKSYFDSTKKFSETDIINMLEFLIDNILFYAWLSCLSTNSRISYWNQLCSPSCQLVPLFLQGRTSYLISHERRNEASLTL